MRIVVGYNEKSCIEKKENFILCRISEIRLPDKYKYYQEALEITIGGNKMNREPLYFHICCANLYIYNKLYRKADTYNLFRQTGWSGMSMICIIGSLYIIIFQNIRMTAHWEFIGYAET